MGQKEIRISLKSIGIVFFATLLCFPDYVGFRFGIAWNIQRILLVILSLWILGSEIRRVQMLRNVLTNKSNILILLYLFVCLITMFVQKDLGSFMKPFLDYVLTFYLALYLLKYEITMKQFLRIIVICAWISVVLGSIEAITEIHLFSFFPHIEGLGGMGIERESVYRICVSGQHPLGYGLYLLLIFPFICFQEDTKSLDILNHPILELLLIFNVFSTGSRSTLGLLIFEMILIVLFSNFEQIKKAILILGPLVCVTILGMILFSDQAFVQKIVLKIVVMVDGVFDTDFAGKWMNYNSFHLEGSSLYRKYLPKIFSLKELNPFIGLGSNHSFTTNIEGVDIVSIDNFYVSQYIKYAYPGLFTLLSLIGYHFLQILKAICTKRNGLYKAFFISFIAYFINLYFVDDLGTLRQLFMFLGVFVYKFKWEA